MDSEQNMNQLDNEVTSEHFELPGRNSKNLQAIGPYPDEEPSTKCSIMECEKNDMKYESVTCQVNTGITKETSVAYLQKELEILRLSNKKLQEKMHKEDREKRKLKLKLELQEKAAEAEIAERTAALVEEVYFAQRERDEAVMCRLQLALEERDEAVARVKHMEMSLKMLENINPEENDMTLQELLSRINNADAGVAIQKNGAIIVDRIYKTKECIKRITAEEMNAVIEERDAALSQCKRLHQELHRLKEQKQTSANNTRHPTAENNQERALKAKLLSMKQARETAVEQYKRLEEEIQTLRVYYRAAAKISDGSQYYVLLIITDGVISDMTQTKEAIVSASSLPMSIIIVGVGPAMFEAMEELDGDDVRVSSRGRYAERDIVQFVPFRDYVDRSGNQVLSMARLAKDVLAEIPEQLLSYMRTRDIQPRPPPPANPGTTSAPEQH